jgi:hypothetical protein
MTTRFPRRNTDPTQQAANALKAAARQRSRPWGWSFCQMFTTVLPREIGGNEAYTVAVDVNGMDHALLSVEQADGRAYTVWWQLSRSSLPMLLGDFDDPAEALAHAEQVIADVAAGLRKVDELDQAERPAR